MDPLPPAQSRSIAFISSNLHWGGSEELWSGAAAALAEAGHRVTVIKGGLDERTPRLERLRALGCRMFDLKRVPFLPKATYRLLAAAAWPSAFAIAAARLRWALRRTRPDFVLVSQGGNVDGLFHLKRVRRLGYPFGIVCQKATEMYWPHDRILDDLRAVYGEARGVWFVSEHNLRLTEEQIAMDLPGAKVVRNPFLVPFDRIPPWPDEARGLSLACVGRLFPREKGQDIVLRVLAREKWRARPVSVTFYGSGDHRRGLEETARYLRLESVAFGGFTDDVGGLWAKHHGLILPSHCEGLPLVLVEAMLSGRVPVVTAVAGNPEVVEDGVTGFLAHNPSDDAVDEALERAWARRSEWRAIGEVAARSIRTMVPESPESAFAAEILKAIEGTARTS